MNRFVLKNTFIKVYVYHFFYKYFFKNKRSKLCFGDRVAVLNDFLYQYERSIYTRKSGGPRAKICVQGSALVGRLSSWLNKVAVDSLE